MYESALEKVVGDIANDLNDHQMTAMIDAACNTLGIERTVDVEREQELVDGTKEKRIEKVPVDVSYVARRMNELGYIWTTREEVNKDTGKLNVVVCFYRAEKEVAYEFDTRWSLAVSRVEELETAPAAEEPVQETAPVTDEENA